VVALTKIIEEAEERCCQRGQLRDHRWELDAKKREGWWASEGSGLRWSFDGDGYCVCGGWGGFEFIMD